MPMALPRRARSGCRKRPRGQEAISTEAADQSRRLPHVRSKRSCSPPHEASRLESLARGAVGPPQDEGRQLPSWRWPGPPHAVFSRPPASRGRPSVSRVRWPWGPKGGEDVTGAWDAVIAAGCRVQPPESPPQWPCRPGPLLPWRRYFETAVADGHSRPGKPRGPTSGLDRPPGPVSARWTPQPSTIPVVRRKFHCCASETWCRNHDELSDPHALLKLYDHRSLDAPHTRSRFLCSLSALDPLLDHVIVAHRLTARWLYAASLFRRVIVAWPAPVAEGIIHCAWWLCGLTPPGCCHTPHRCHTPQSAQLLAEWAGAALPLPTGLARAIRLCVIGSPGL